MCDACIHTYVHIVCSYASECKHKYDIYTYVLLSVYLFDQKSDDDTHGDESTPYPEYGIVPTMVSVL